MIVTTRAIVLHSIRYGDQKVIVSLLTQTEGRLSVVARIPTTQRGKLKKQLFQPMNIIEAQIDIRPQAELQHFRDIRLAIPYSSIPFHAEKLAIALFLAEFIYYGTREERNNPNLYDYIENSLLWLDGCQHDFANFHLVFMMRMTRFIGFYPNIEDYHPGDYFDLQAACFTHQPPLQVGNDRQSPLSHSSPITQVLNAEDASHISTLMRMNYESMHLFRMSHHERNRITNVLIQYYRLHVSGFPQLQSLAVVQELWK